VLRGAGATQTRLWFKDGAGLSTPAALTVSGALQESDQDGWALVKDGAIFETYVDVQDAGGLVEGDDISITWQITEEFKQEHHSEKYWYFLQPGDRRTFFRRTVTAVQGNRVWFKVPLRYPVKLRDKPTLRKAAGYLSHNGIEHLAVNTALGSPDASWNSGTDQATAIVMRSCKDCWIHDVSSFTRQGEKFDLRSNGINVVTSFRVTVSDCALHRAEHLGPNGNGYLFQLMQSNEVLLRDCTASEGRHNFILNWDFGTCGNVMLRVHSSGGRSCDNLQMQKLGVCGVGACDFHHALAMANLVDSSSIDDALQVGNRQDWSTGAGQTGTMNVFWNVAGGGNVYAYNQGMGYVIGTGAGTKLSTSLTIAGWPQSYASPGTEPEDFSEFVGVGDTLHPQSLYEDQLARRQ
jgi:hypothetical protein